MNQCSSGNSSHRHPPVPLPLPRPRLRFRRLLPPPAKSAAPMGGASSSSQQSSSWSLPLPHPRCSWACFVVEPRCPTCCPCDQAGSCDTNTNGNQWEEFISAVCWGVCRMSSLVLASAAIWNPNCCKHDIFEANRWQH